MDPHSRAIPHFVVTMASAVKSASAGFYMGKGEDPIPLPPSFARHFSLEHNPDSPILHRYHQLLPTIAARGAPTQAANPLTHFVYRTSTKSARDRLRQDASTRRLLHLHYTAPPDLQADLSEILIAATSYPLINLPRSTKSHRRPNDLFLIALKSKLFLDIFPPTNLPTCVCGSTIDRKGKHVFHCKKVSKWRCHNLIRNGFCPVISRLLATANIIPPNTDLHIEPPGILPHLPNLRPFDFSFRPSHNLSIHDQAPIPFGEIGFDVTITPPKGHLTPSQLAASSTQPAPAAQKHLIDKEKKKLLRGGATDANDNYLKGNVIMGQLLDQNMVLIPLAISPYGRWGPMFHTFLFGPTPYLPTPTFQSNHSNAARMYHRATTSPCPIGLLPLATARWKATKNASDHFYGHSHTTPTPKEYALQQLGLVISNSLALHLRDAKRGTLRRAPPPGFGPLPTSHPPTTHPTTPPTSPYIEPVRVSQSPSDSPFSIHTHTHLFDCHVNVAGC